MNTSLSLPSFIRQALVQVLGRQVSTKLSPLLIPPQGPCFSEGHMGLGRKKVLCHGRIEKWQL